MTSNTKNNPNNAFTISLDKDRRIISFDPGAAICASLGYILPGSENEDEFAIGSPLPDSLETLICSDDIKEVRSVATRREHATIRMRLRTGTGSFRWFEVVLDVKHNDEDGSVYASGNAFDIQDEIERDKLLRDKLSVISKLEQSEAALLREQERAKHDKIRWNHIISKLSHDVRTAMNSIIGYADLALDSPGDPDTTLQSLREIRTAGHALMHLLSEMFELGRIQSGEIHLSKERVSLTSILNSAAESLKDEMREKIITFIHREVELLHDQVISDMLCMKQILVGLLLSAVDAAVPESVISLTLKEEHEPMGQIGLDEVLAAGRVSKRTLKEGKEAVRYSFKIEFTKVKGYRDDPSSVPAQSLSISKKFIAMLGGDISYSEEKGTNCCYDVSIPLSPTDEVVSTASTDTVFSTDSFDNHGAVRSISGMHVLVVEDNAVNLALAKAVLAKRQITFETASNGLEAVKTVTDAGPGHFDLILMDIRMPVMDGLEASDRIRMLEDPRLSSIPILAMTAEAFEEDRKRCFDHGMDGYICKPFKTEDLSAAIEKATRGTYSR